MELCTPTGAALLRHFADEYGPMPQLQIEAIGYGMGTRDAEGRLNALRAFMGTVQSHGSDVLEFVCNIDDMTAEEIGFALDRLMAAGALDAWTTPIGMKKCRPGTMLSCLCRKEDTQMILDCIFKYTSTLGVRQYEPQRHILLRSNYTEDTELGKIRVKRGYLGAAVKTKPEFDDLAAFALEQDKSLCQVRTELSMYPEMRRFEKE